jgi:phosphohistidine phosphatase
MRVVLFRHGPAGTRDAARWPDDAKRPLTPKGAERTHVAALGLRRLLAADDVLIVTSPLARCLGTAQILREAFSGASVTPLAALAPQGSYRQILAFLREQKPNRTLVLVGHEPDLGKLAGVLVFGAPSPLPMRKSGACLVKFVGEVEPGAGRLQWFLGPRPLRRFAGKKSHA